jgi:hypothetical protein
MSSCEKLGTRSIFLRGEKMFISAIILGLITFGLLLAVTGIG